MRMLRATMRRLRATMRMLRATMRMLRATTRYPLFPTAWSTTATSARMTHNLADPILNSHCSPLPHLSKPYVNHTVGHHS
eukprot:7411849-Pyramimonas_sp.AAC.1